MRNDHGVIYRSIHLGQHCWSVVRDVAAFARVIAVAKLLGSDPTWTADRSIKMGRSTSLGGPRRNLSRFHWGEDGQHQKRILSDLPAGSNWAYRTHGGVVPAARDVTRSLPSSSSRLGQRESGDTPQ